MTEREAGGSGSGPLPLREIDGIVRRAGPVSLTIEDVVLLVLRADPRPVTGAGRLTGLVLRALTEAIGGRDTEPAVFEGVPGGPRSAAVERALDNLSFSNCVRVSGGGGSGRDGAPSFEIAPRGRDRIGTKWDALPDGARRALSQARAGRGVDAPDVLKEGVYVHNDHLLKGGPPAAPEGCRGGRPQDAEDPDALGVAGEAKHKKCVDRGNRLLAAGQYAEAYANYKMAAGLRTQDVALHLKMALCMGEMGLYRDALKHCKAAIKADPAVPDGYIAMGHCLSKLGEHAKAFSYSKRAVLRGPTNYHAYMQCGTTLHRLGRYAEAVPHYQRAASLRPGHVEAHLNAHLSLFRLERYGEALRHAERAAKMAPEDSAVHARVVGCLLKLGRHEDAIPAGLKAIEAAPGRAGSYLPLIVSLHGLNRHEEALEWCKQAAEAGAPDLHLHFLMALSLRALGRHEEALAHCKKSIEIDPHNTDFHAAMSQILRDLKRLPEALSHCKAVLSAEPDNLPVLSNMGSMLAEMGRHDEALTCLDRALQIDPHQPVPRYNRALSLQETDRPRRALKEYRQVVKLDPTNTGAYNNMGTVLAALDRDGEALVHFDRAIELDSGNAAAHLNKALSLRRLNLPGEALVHFDRAIELNPGNSDAYVGRLSCLDELGLQDEAFGHYAKKALGPAMVTGGAGSGDAERHASTPPRPRRQRAPAPTPAAGEDRAQLVESLLSEDESEVLEFKSWPGPQGSGKMAGKIARELCSLVNTRGGNLLIGVGDGGAVEGLVHGGAGRRLSREERGEMLAWVTNVIVEYFGAEHDGHFDRKIVGVDGLDVLHCAVAASRDGPIILKNSIEKKHDFFVRAGSTCRPLGSKDMLEYVKKTWPDWASRPRPMGFARASGQEGDAAIAAMGGQDADLQPDGMPGQS